MNELRVLYAIFVPNGPLRSALDAIRMIAHPQAKHAAHVTVRGPYPDYRDPRTWSAAIRDKSIAVDGTGTFWNTDQNTVFLRVDSPDLRLIWDKPDYSEYNPHLTIYDGPSRAFAESLFGIFAECDPHFTFIASGLEPIVSGNGLPPLVTRYEPSELSTLLRCPPSRPEVIDACERDRLAWIAELAEHILPAVCSA